MATPSLRQQLEDAARVIAGGGIVAYPTESCFGLGCDPRSEPALARLLRVKQRSYRLGLILIAEHEQRLWRYVLGGAHNPNWARPRDSWPGPFTWLMPVAPGVSARLRGSGDKIALRVTAHPLAGALCRHVGGPLVSTSANRHGHPPAKSAAKVRAMFGAQVDCVIAGRLGTQPRPTEIRDAVSGDIVRAG